MCKSLSSGCAAQGRVTTAFFCCFSFHKVFLFSAFYIFFCFFGEFCNSVGESSRKRAKYHRVVDEASEPPCKPGAAAPPSPPVPGLPANCGGTLSWIALQAHADAAEFSCEQWARRAGPAPTGWIAARSSTAPSAPRRWTSRRRPRCGRRCGAPGSSAPTHAARRMAGVGDPQQRQGVSKVGVKNAWVDNLIFLPTFCLV